MKKIIRVMVLVLSLQYLAPTSFAIDPSSFISVGVTALNYFLNNLAYQGNIPGQLASVLQIINGVNLSSSNITSLHRSGYNYGEIYYLGLIQQATGLSTHQILTRKSNGIGWGELAHLLGVNPGDLNKRRVAIQKGQDKHMNNGTIHAKTKNDDHKNGKSHKDDRDHGNSHGHKKKH